jgi:hypothetical protein
MHRNTLPSAITLSMNTCNLKKFSTYHGVLVSLGYVLHFVTDGRIAGGWFWTRTIALSELCCELV